MSPPGDRLRMISIGLIGTAMALTAIWVLARLARPLFVGEAPPETADGEESPDVDPETQRRLLERLEAVGYVSWDDEADTGISGVTRLDPARSAAGYNIYSDETTEQILLDLEGNRLHTWRFPCAWAEYAELLPNGDLAVLCLNDSLVLLDWQSNVLWSLRLRVHHDVDLVPDGSLVVLSRKLHRYQERNVYFDEITTVSSGGELLHQWSTFDHLDGLHELHDPMDLTILPKPAPDPTIFIPRKLNYYHANTVEVLPPTPLGERDPRFRPGNLLICLRNVDLIAILDQETYEVVWSWGSGMLDLPHMPTMLDDGNILVFDNGTHRGYSRILELRPPDGEIVWQYEGEPREAFFSPYRGSNQRLWNGNTLICESERGHAFEVTPEGEIVWEFWNPELRGPKRRRIYRFMRIPSSIVEPLLSKDPNPSDQDPS